MADEITAEQISRLLELAAKASAGPFFWPFDNTLAAGSAGDPDGEWTTVLGVVDQAPVSAPDARYIVEACNLAPALAREVQRLQAENDKLRSSPSCWYFGPEEE